MLGGNDMEFIPMSTVSDRYYIYVNNEVVGVLEYKEYLTVEQLLNLERIKDGEYFSLLKVFSIPIMDNSKTREQLAKALFQEIEVSKRLVKSISV